MQGRISRASVANDRTVKPHCWLCSPSYPQSKDQPPSPPLQFVSDPDIRTRDPVLRIAMESQCHAMSAMARGRQVFSFLLLVF